MSLNTAHLKPERSPPHSWATTRKAQTSRGLQPARPDLHTPCTHRPIRDLPPSYKRAHANRRHVIHIANTHRTHTAHPPCTRLTRRDNAPHTPIHNLLMQDEYSIQPEGLPNRLFTSLISRKSEGPPVRTVSQARILHCALRSVVPLAAASRFLNTNFPIQN